ncbi:MAG: hypothetical protein AAFY76_03200, partial [Cyanobacteria bacterium J06649_11]
TFLKPMIKLHPSGIESLPTIELNHELAETKNYTEQEFSPSDFDEYEPYYDLEPRDFLDFNRLKFSQLDFIWSSTQDEKTKDELMAKAKKSAKERLKELKYGKSKSLVEEIYERTHENVSLTNTLNDNHLPLTSEHIEIAYNSWRDGASAEPWILMALWFQEGSGRKSHKYTKPPIYVSNPQNAKSNWKARAYYWLLGADHYVNYRYDANAEDNIVPYYDDTDAINNEKVFKSRVKEQYRSGRLPRDISSEINSNLLVKGSPTTGYIVTPNLRFFELSIMLAAAFYNEKKAALQNSGLVKGDVSKDLNAAISESKRLKKNDDLNKYEEYRKDQENTIDPALIYVSWNTGNFSEFINSAEGHRKENEYEGEDGQFPSVTEWAFGTKPKAEEYRKVRKNAMRFKYYVEVFKLVFEGQNIDLE